MAHEVYDSIARVSAAIVKSTSPDERARLNTELLKLNEKIPRNPGRKAEFNDADTDDAPTPRSLEVRVKALYERPSRNDAERETARQLDANDSPEHEVFSRMRSEQSESTQSDGHIGWRGLDSDRD